MATRSKPRAKSPSKKNVSARRILNCVPSKETENDWLFENAVAAGLVAAAAIPASKDLRAPSWWEIGNQESTGACVGWATADSVIRWHLVKANRIGQKELLSTRYIWMASKEIDEFTSAPTTFIESEGTSLKSALDVARKYGCVPDTVLPFELGTLYPGEGKTFYAIASKLKIANYINLGRNLDKWRQWLAFNGPILTRLDVDRTWDQATENDGRLDLYDPTSVRGGHAVAMVGYDNNSFIIRNSWGTSWGDDGFAYASNKYAATAFTEAYGVTLP